MLRHSRLTDRRGGILIVVLALLSLFAIVGITFVLFASASAEKQRIRRDTLGGDFGPAITDNGEKAFALFLSELIYPMDDAAGGVYSSLRGHDLVRKMY